jgi:diaminopimelate decarboxylase
MYHLTPLISKNIRNTLSNKNKIYEWLTAFGSPLNIVYPEAVVDNISGFKKIFVSHKIKGEIFYAYKANKSVAILKHIAASDIKVDVASEKELQKALSAGFTGYRIEATGPKNEEFVRLALFHGVILNINSLQELETIKQVKKRFDIKGSNPVFLRLKEFKSSTINIIQKDVKFGLSIDEAKKAIEEINNFKYLDFYGFSFHLPTTSVQKRVIATEQALFLTLEAIKLGLNPRGVNIGGGFSTNLLENEKEWSEYVSVIKDSLVNPSNTIMSWNQSGLGYWSEEGKIRGSAKFSDFYRNNDQFQELDKLLNTKTQDFGKIGQFLQENGLTLFIEPGRSLLDQAGVTLAKVISVSKSLKGENIIFLDMNRSNMNSTDLEFMSDPVVLSLKEKSEHKENSGCFLSGNLCLPHDFICRRKVFLKECLEPGDILVFINTAAYFMDFTESETIQHPLAFKIAINESKWALDEKYNI